MGIGNDIWGVKFIPKKHTGVANIKSVIQWFNTEINSLFKMYNIEIDSNIKKYVKEIDLQTSPLTITIEL